jgi:murein DD-endopeptidase MepM/ murein hydrolase activator NlpD
VPTPPTADDVVEMGFTLDLPAGKTQEIARPFTFYAGGGVQSFAFRLTIKGSRDIASSVDVLSSSGTQLQHIAMTDLPGSGEITTVRVDGNNAILKVLVPTGLPAPTVLVRALETTTTTRGAFPVDSPPGPHVTAFPLQPGVPIDVPLGPQVTRYFTVAGQPPPATFDLLVSGGGALVMADPSSSDYPVASSSVQRREDLVPLMPRMLRWTGESDTLRLAITTEGLSEDQRKSQPSHARIALAPVPPTSAKLAFPSPRTGDFIRSWVLHVDHDGSAGPNWYVCTTYDGTSETVTVDPPDIPLPGGKKIVTPAVSGPRIPAVCYDSHQGTDFPLALGPVGQALGVDVSAAAPGMVMAVTDGDFDKCFLAPTGSVACPGSSPQLENFLAVHQDDGLIAFYFHIRRGSALVKPGDRVACGQLLAQAASSGDSIVPHLHFELQKLPDLMSPDGLADFTKDTVRGLGRTIDPYPALWGQLPRDDLPSPTCP